MLSLQTVVVLEYTTSTNSWFPWVSLGGILTSAPTDVDWGSGVDEVVCAQHQPYPLAYYGHQYLPLWLDHRVNPPGVGESGRCLLGLRDLDLFVRSDNGVLVHRTYTGTKGSPLTPSDNWVALGGNSVENYAVAGW
jgi:hypothetical protein